MKSCLFLFFRDGGHLFEIARLEIRQGIFDLPGSACVNLDACLEQDLRRLPPNVPRQDDMDIFSGY